MPRLPTADQLGQRPTPRSGGGISPLRLTTPRLGQQQQALVEFGQAVKGLGDTMAIMAVKEKQELDGAIVEESYNNYDNGLLELEDGEKGYRKVLTGEAVKRPLADEYREQRKALGTSIRDKLKNDDQKRAFDQRVNIADRQFDGRLYRHVAEQSRAYQGIVSEGVQETERRKAALHWDQPGQIEMSILRTNIEIERKARLDGMDPASPEDKQVIDALKSIAETRIHANVIEQMLTQGMDTSASAYFKTIKERLTPEAIVTLGAKVDAAGVDGEAVRGADAAWNILGPRSLADVPRQDLMEAWIRDRYKDDPTTKDAAISDLRSRTQAFKDGRQEQAAAYKAAVLDAYEKGADLKQIQAMPEYRNSLGDDRIAMRDYIVNNGWSERSRAIAQAEYEQGAKASAAYGAYLELSNPQVLNTISENQIASLLPTFGQKLTGDLMKAKRKLTSPENVRAATIDAELFNSIAADAGLDPYRANPGADHKEMLGRLKNEVEATIDMAQEDKQGPLGRKEKEEIMQKIIDTKVLERHWYGDKSLPAAVVKPDQRKDVVVPIKDIDPAWMKKAINYMRSVGAMPNEMEDEMARLAFKGRLEKAYANSLTGGTTAEGNAILAGEE